MIVGYVLANIAIGSLENVQFNGIEFSCFIYLAVTGTLGFNEDFKMAIQNGFTRKEIFIASISMFGFVASIMALIDTLMAQVIRSVVPIYQSLFQQIYGMEHNILIQWLILALLYFLVAGGAYLCTLISNKVGKRNFYFVFITLGLLILVILPLVLRMYIPSHIMTSIITFLTKLVGFSATGTIHFINPISFVIVLGGIISGCSYLTIRRTELK